VSPQVAGCSGLQPFQMMSSQYCREAVAICVVPRMVDRHHRLVCADAESERNLERYASFVQQMAPAGTPDPYAWALAKMHSLLEAVFPDDTWVSAPAGYPPLLLVKQAVLLREGLSLIEAVELSHLGHVERALQLGQPVPESVLTEYQLRARMPGDRDLH
jgi:hypothetical protein